MNTTTDFGYATGPVHSGTGHLNYFNLIGAAAPSAETRDPRRAAGDAIAYLKKRHVVPEGMKRARHLLETSNVVLLTASAGNGARSTAKVLLWGFPHGEERFCELLDQSEEEDGGHALKPEQIEEEASLLLDLSDTAEERYRAFMNELPDFRARVREKGARLAVVLGHGPEAPFNEELRELVTPLGRPDEREVLRKHLLGDGISPAEHELTGRELSDFLARAQMARIAALSNRIREARDARHGDGEFSAWLETALTAGKPGDEQAKKKLNELSTGPQRALLLSAALLEGARPDTVHEAANQLLRVSAHPEKYCPALEQQSLGNRLENIDATTDDGQVRFNEPELAEAVRRHFWDNLPHMRPRLCSWIADADGFPSISRSDLLNLVARYADERLRTGPPDDLTDLAAHWTRPEASRQQLPMAARALAKGVLDPRHGSHFRYRIYRWSREGNLPRGRAEVLIGVCSEALAVDFPQQALVRLHHLSHRRDRRVRETAREALWRITRSDAHLYRLLLERLDPLRDRTGRHDTRSFLHIASPTKLLDDAAVRARLTEHWAAAMARTERTDWQPAFHSWLTQAHKATGKGKVILGVLADACGRDGTTLGVLYAVADEWAHSDESADATRSRLRTADALWSLATTALGINPSTHPR